MRILTLLAAFLLLSQDAHACGGASRCPTISSDDGPFEVLKGCQSLDGKSAKMKSADRISRTAGKHLERAKEMVDTFQASCAAYKANPTQDEQSTRRIGREGTDAAEASRAAHAAAKEALDELRLMHEPVRALGGKSCGDSIQAALTEIQSRRAELEQKSAGLAGCTEIGAKPVPRYPTEGRQCGLAGCIKNADGTFSPRQQR
jgi:hypothetical protein